MKNQTYYTRLSSGSIYRVEFATSAGEAIYQSLFANRGSTVTECWQGPEIQDRRYPPGHIRYEVPPHDPIAIDVEKPKRRKKDDTATLGFMQVWQPTNVQPSSTHARKDQNQLHQS